MSDLISRQAAIEAIDRLDIPEDMCVFEILSHIELEIGTLPSAQPEIIMCKDCKHKGTKNRVANAWTTIFGFMVKDDFYCGLAERRTDEQ